MSSEIYDVTIVGAGAAGMMAALSARRKGAEVLLLDGKKKVGAKILMSGGTRCNVTNQKVSERDFNSWAPRTVRNILRAFSSDRAATFFESLGVKLLLEPGGKYFPETHSARTVLDALLSELKKIGVQLVTDERVSAVKKTGDLFVIEGKQRAYKSHAVIVTTGGLSYPTTGSDGAGYAIATSFGHTIVPTTPALTPFRTPDKDWQSLQGITLLCRLTLMIDNKEEVSYEDSFLFTHFGFSGPAVLNMSRHWLRAEPKQAVQLWANFLPAENEASLTGQLIEAARNHPERSLKRYLSEQFPERFVGVFLGKIEMKGEITLGQFLKQERARLVKQIQACALPVSGVAGYGKAEVTAGGVDLAELDSRTLASRKVPGLFFAGETVDVDGRIGGFNFQWAWSSGVVTGETAATHSFSTRKHS